MSTRSKTVWVVAITILLAGAAYASWSESFDGGKLNLSTWQFLACPDVMHTYKAFVQTAPDGNGYLVLQETSPSDVPALLGAAFGAGIGSQEVFKDVRVGATVNVGDGGDHSYYGFLARATMIIDAEGKLYGVPAFFTSSYLMHVNYSRGPANLMIDIEKVVTDPKKSLANRNIMEKDLETVVPRVENARSYYAELEVVGAGPVYVIGRLYESKGGALVAETPMMVDTNGKDWWEAADKHDAVFTEGISAVFGQNEDPEPPGFYCTWDDISSASDGPAAVVVSPANGATGVSMQATLSWVEAKFATGRQLWLGTPGNLQLVDPAPTGTSYVTGLLEPGQIYQWRVDQVGATGTVTGHTWQFTTGQGIAVDDFESYADNAQTGAAWVDNIPGAGNDYALLDTGTVFQGAKALRLDYQNQYDPFLTEAVRTFAASQDWTIKGVDMLSIAFRGLPDNVEQPMYVKVADAAGQEATVTHAAKYAVQSEPWRSWDIALVDLAGVDLKSIAKLTIGVGEGTTSGQADKDVDALYIDNIRLGFLPPK